MHQSGQKAFFELGPELKVELKDLIASIGPLSPAPPTCKSAPVKASGLPAIASFSQSPPIQPTGTVK